MQRKCYTALAVHAFDTWKDEARRSKQVKKVITDAYGPPRGFCFVLFCFFPMPSVSWLSCLKQIPVRVWISLQYVVGMIGASATH